MNAAWEVVETRGYIPLRLVCLRVLLGTAVLFVLSFMPAYGPGFIKNLQVPWIAAHQPLHVGIRVVFELIAWATDICMFVVLYRALPNAIISWKSALFGGSVAGICWELLKQAFAVYVRYVSAETSAYGALGGAFLLVSWVYYSCSVLLIGPILCKMYHEHCEHGSVELKASAEQTKPE
jgi:membrane protein